jgi:hypothetical protein
MVCRVRLRDDDLKSGVGAQRGTGMHREWVKAQEQLREQAGGAGAQEVGSASATATVPPPLDLDTAAGNSLVPMESPDATSIGVASSIPPSPAVLEHPPEGEGRRRDSIVNAAAEARHRSTNSYASTNSSFLVRHFPRRFFILKSATTVSTVEILIEPRPILTWQEELQEAVKTGTWRTQRHNEPVLDQAFRTASEVILIFGANKAGEFFGYARMVEPIDKEKAARRAALQSAGSAGSGSGGSGGSAESVFKGAGAGASGIEAANAITEAEHAAAAAQRAHAIRGANPDAQRSAPALSAYPPGQSAGGDASSSNNAADRDRARAGTDPTRPKYLTAHSSSSQVNVSSSPGQMTPATELPNAMDRPPLSHCSSPDMHSDSVASSEHFSIVSAPPAFPALAQRTRPISSDFSDSDKAGSLPLPGSINTNIAKVRAEHAAHSAPVDAAGKTIADIQVQIGGSKRPAEKGDDGVLRKDTAVTGAERAKAEIGLVSAGKERVDALEGRLAAAAQMDGPINPQGQGAEGDVQDQHDRSAPGDPDSKGLPFRIEWVKVGSLPFARTRMLRNPWNNDREVKVSRDGTEVEPGTCCIFLRAAGSAWQLVC